MLTRGICVLAALALLVAPAAAGNFSWIFQETEQFSGASALALAMRGGNVWPVVFSPYESAALLPTGWADMGSMYFNEAPPAAVSSPTGEVAAWSTIVGSTGNAVVSTPTGWSAFSADALAFDSEGRLWKAVDQTVSYLDGGAWHALPGIPEYRSICGLAVASNGEVGAITADGPLYYYHYGPCTGWTRSEDLNTDGPQLTEAPSLVFDGQNIPHIVGASWDGDAVALDFDIRSGEWQHTYLGNVDSTRLAVKASGDIVGTAFVADHQLYHAYLDDGIWSTVPLPTGGGTSASGPAPDTGSVGFEYDADGVPVIAYAASGEMILAYDPPVPEPTTLALLGLGGLGGLAVLRRRA